MTDQLAMQPWSEGNARRPVSALRDDARAFAHALRALTRHGMAQLAFVALLAALLPGCTTFNHAPAAAYYRYDFIDAREALRPMTQKVDNDYLLNELRLGLACMADGNVNEAESSLERVFSLLSTAGLNRDSTVGAVLIHEGVRVWKGEPFEQALAYYWVAAHYASVGDWENARAAAANALFRLRDFGEAMNAEELARRAAKDDSILDSGYTAVDSDFALGFLMQAIAADLSGAAGAPELFDAALRIDPGLGGIVEPLRRREYDTLLLVDYGRGPQKIAYGPDNSLTRFVDRERWMGPLRVTVNGVVLGDAPAACDVDDMAKALRWKNLEDVRKAKSAIGNLLFFGGSTAAVIGGGAGSDAAVAAGLGALLAGLLVKASAEADVRYLDFAPAAIYVVPLQLDANADVELTIPNTPVRLVLPDLPPGTATKPRAIYLRLFGSGCPAPAWLTSTELVYTNDATIVRPGDRPWVLGGADVGTPTRERLQAYQAGGELVGWTISDLRDLYANRGITIGAGMDRASEEARWRSFRHILDRGTGLFTPLPDTIGYKRLMFRPVTPYVPAAP